MDSVMVKFPMTIKAKLTEKLRASMLEDFRNRITQAQLEIQQLNIQENRALSEVGEDNQEEIAMINQHFGIERQKREDFVAQTEAQIADTEKLALGAEIIQGTTERFVELKKGDNVRDQFNVEVVVEDDVIIAIRS
ncbi:YlqD family protein [Anaerovibrio sp.]|uniref:YlqD family protein n=1 Tax=Anaerovibrio sp. TaxID=1872532 RepID=UPI001B4C3FFE|nr:YlqD family protein [Anaerovibrio sp.]MBP3232408.1 16S rRNA processing protein RimM [Anaerovibrio sp.]MBR2143757.1 16S rRNA processing protein RimM [Anaerovibrio sp.]